MITECYIKGRFDYGVGKCAVVIAENGKIVHQRGWRVPEAWDYEGEAVEADQFNCEILAATYALKWCMENDRNLVNIYANTTTCQKWYFRGEFTDARKVMGKAYLDMMDALQHKVEGMEGEHVREVVFAEYIPKKSDNMFNMLVNELAEKTE
jgi:hypothetical protein